MRGANVEVMVDAPAATFAVAGSRVSWLLFLWLAYRKVPRWPGWSVFLVVL